MAKRDAMIITGMACCLIRTMAKEIFDYDKLNEDYSDRRYYGFHRRNGRLAIDTKRLTHLRIYKSYFPEGIFSTPRNTHYFVPKKIHKFDYKVNVLISMIEKLRVDWNEEYIPFIKSIKTQNDLFEEIRLSRINETSCMDDLDEINLDAFLESVPRIPKYCSIINSIFYQYIQKISIDYQRALASVLEADPESIVKEDFTINMLRDRVQSTVARKKVNPIFGFKSYKYLDLLVKIDNFLKHNSVFAYKKLADNNHEKDEEYKHFLQNYVRIETKNEKYKTGMYAGNWLELPDDFIPMILNELACFSSELCKCLYDEDINEASWNYDDYLLAILDRDCINCI